MLLHWITNDNRCFLTQMENRLNNVKNYQTVYERLSNNFHISIEQSEVLVIYGTTFIWTIAIVRLLKWWLL